MFEAEGCSGEEDADAARQCRVVRAILADLGMVSRIYQTLSLLGPRSMMLSVS